MSTQTQDFQRLSDYWYADLDFIPWRAVVRCPMCRKYVTRGCLEIHVRDEHYHHEDDRRTS